MSIIKNNQSAFDISTQINGDVRSVVDFCIKNNLSLTQDIQPATPYDRANTLYFNEEIANFFINKDYELTTSEPKILIEPIGIGLMQIESDFDIT